MKYRFDGMQQFSFNISNINHKITISKNIFQNKYLLIVLPLAKDPKKTKSVIVDPSGMEY